MIKNINRKKSAIAVALACSVMATFSYAEDSIKLDKVEVRGILPERLESVPGSFSVVDEKELEVRRPFSVQEALNNVPGVHVVGEGAQSLNLNIGVRGLNPRRTSRTLLLEDGMPLFLAPYGDPSAHYATPLERVQRIEVVKGSGQILYGPQTVGGMINFVTKPVPKNGFEGSVSATAGNNDFRGIHLNLGYGGERGGFMVDALNRKGDGIRKDHDFEVNDVTVKGQLNLTDTQSLVAKVGWYEENSHYTEAGLDTARYNANPSANPFGKNDTFEHERKSLQLVHNWMLTDKAKLTTQAYYVNSDRASYRQTDESLDQMTRRPGPSGSPNIATCPNDAARVDYENFSNLCGNKMRPREYNYWGVEPRLDFSHDLFGINSDAVLGFRYHEEDINRKRYNGATPRARENDPGSALRDDSDIKVESTALYGQNTFFLGDFALTPGLRMERLKQTNKLNTVNFVSSDLKDSDTDTTLLPGFGVAWNGIANTTVFAGIHRGFAPPRPDRDLNPTRALGASPEKSTNTELGFRTSYFKGITFESTLFNIDFDNLVVGPVNGEFLNAGKSQNTGIEMAGRVDFGAIYNTPHNFYLTANYTSLFTAKFKKDAATDGIESGNRLPYAPRDLASVNFGYSHPIGIDARFGIDYVSQQYSDNENSRVETANGQDGIIPSYTLLNASVNFRPVGSKASYFLSGHNLADKEYLTNRIDGMFLGRGRQVFGGIRYDF
ncbi:MAG: TonB-dependent receptor [Methylotenera sp.]|nr:TonB-dependent receptor [Methylotenera sp.]MDP2403785.1 TonB-dependent receptor [Methylotenera sp.]MDP3095171.1 TonB-dependent receptor [Methylotenera sp.]MDZ4224058.1 TonB-dependent receptor [Methylotenera sp.]